MDATRWDELETLFGQALVLPPDERPAFLDKACRGDTALRAELDSLLNHYDQAPGYFDDLAEAVPVPGLPFTGNPAQARHDPDPYQIQGTTISHYRVLEKLGAGGMGVVYKAQDTKLGRLGALKFLPPHLHADAQTRHRFMAEAKAASALDHPNICTIYEIGETDDGQLFIAMAYYDGLTLKKKIKRGSLTPDEALGLAVQMTRGLAKAHDKGIVHRDVKPANVMVTDDSVVKILDFGLAKMADVQLTKTGTTMGTVAYMSPEQTRGETVDHRTDIWSLGVVLYEMLTGVRPFKGDYDQAIVYSILHETPAPLTEVDPSLPEELEHVVAMCLEKDRAVRYPNTADLLADLEILTHRSGSASTSVTSAALRAMQRRRSRMPRKLVALGGGVLLVLAAMLAYFISRPLTPAGASAPAPPLHLAVMPFSDVGTDTTDLAYREGLRLTLTSVLTRMSQHTGVPLWIVPASEISEEMKIAEARATFGVNRVITGRVQHGGAQTHLILDLSETAPLLQRNSVTITESSERGTSMEAGLVSGLAELLEIPLTPQAQRALTAGGTAHSRAYEFYLKGRPALERMDQPESTDLAIQLFQFALEEDSLYAQALAGLGRAYGYKFEQTRDTLWIARAEHSSHRALALDDRLPEARMTLGLLHLKTGDYEAAIREYDLALALDSSNADLYLNKAVAQEQLRRPEMAEETYLQGIAVRPEYHRLYNRLGLHYLNKGRYEEAAAQFRRVIDLTPDNAWGYNNLGAALLALQRLGDARETFEQALEIEPSFFAYSNLGVIAYHEKRYRDEAERYEQALALDSSDYRVWGNLANAYARLPEERPQARRMYQRAIEKAEARYQINPNFPQYTRNLARYHKRMGDLYRSDLLYPDAIAAYTRALTFDEHSDDIWDVLAETFAQLPGKEAQAQEARQRAVREAETKRKNNPDDVRLLSRLADYYARLNQPARAVPLLEHALTVAPDQEAIMVEAGRLYERLGQREKALAWIQKAFEHGYTHEDIEQDSAFIDLRADARYTGLLQQHPAPS